MDANNIIYYTNTDYIIHVRNIITNKACLDKTFETPENSNRQITSL